VQSVKLDDTTYASSWLPLSKLHAGVNQLQFTMGPQPDKQRGTSEADRPPLFR
jgi:putative alpha-1,2-mannosidase